MAFIDGTVVNVSLPALQANLNATVQDVQWVVESYALLLASLLLIGGSMGDRFGRRRVFSVGVSVFALASVACGASQSINQLIVARAVQGVGAALLVPGSLAIISASFNEERRGKAIGTWSGFTAITAAVGPILGGWLIDHVSWRAVFLINVPLAAVVLAISILRVPESKGGGKQKHLDWPGAVLTAAGLGAVVYALIESSRLGFGSAMVLAAFIGGVAVLAAFFVVEARSPNAMLPLALFGSRNFSGANLLTLFLYAALSGGMFFIPLELIQVRGFSATAAGAAWLPFILIMFLLSRWSGGLVKNYGSKLPLVVGPIVAAFGFALFIIRESGDSYWTSFFPAIVVVGLGMAISVAPLTTTVMSAVPDGYAGVASGVNNAVSRLAGLLGIAVFGVVILATFGGQLESSLAQLPINPEVRGSVFEQRARLAAVEVPAGVDDQTRMSLKSAINDSFRSGLRVVMAAASGLALASALSAFMMIGGKPSAKRLAALKVNATAAEL
jgi:EmrB/QacA subfamily drug resistance transporter